MISKKKTTGNKDNQQNKSYYSFSIDSNYEQFI
jgi:hypothetical protein